MLVNYRADDRTAELIGRRGFEFKGYDRLCPMLAARRLGLKINSQNGVLAERSYGWVSVALYREKTNVIGSFGRTQTVISRTASSPAADDAMMEALSDTLTVIADAPDAFIEAVGVEEAKVRRALAAGS